MSCLPDQTADKAKFGLPTAEIRLRPRVPGRAIRELHQHHKSIVNRAWIRVA